ncbi:MAG: NifB/NifX family molybdenum-iron cluster-binding protein [Clostridium sp.]|nr:NifB/NifX family molybdenum-iron cluster-binding protein [Clostridium sp.]
MKVCIPVKENKGVESIPYNHFGSAPYFIIYDTESKEIKTIENGDLNHAHGMCQPLKALSGEKVDVVLVGGIGAGAINKLKSQSIKVCRVVEGTIEENIELLKEDKLVEFSINNICSNHDCHH